MMPARSISLWLMISASEGASLKVEMKNCDTRIKLPVAGAALFYSKIGAAISLATSCFHCVVKCGRMAQISA
jgi:hypothetical protein